MGEPSDADQPLIGPRSLLVVRRGLRRYAEAVVQTGSRLDHYRRRLDRPDRPWLRMATVTEHAAGPGALALAGRSLVVVVPEGPTPASYRLREVSYRLREADHRLSEASWTPHEGIPVLNAPARPESAQFEDRGHDSFHLIAVSVAKNWALAQLDGSIFGYRRSAGRWERDSCLRAADAEPFTIEGPESVKLAQLSGERDATATPWGERAPTLSASVSTAGILGTDLAVRFQHDGHDYLLFGDTHWRGRPWLRTRDAIAEVVEPGSDRPQVRFHGSPLKLVGAPLLGPGRVTMREYDVPLDGFSHGGNGYVFFSSNHFRHGQVMGRSVLARLDPGFVVDPAARRRPIRCRVIGTFSSRHFRNVSVQLRPASAVPGCKGEGEVLLLWGTGSYRASEVRLALLDQAALAGLAEGSGLAGVQYFDGSGWSPEEADAVALFGPAAIGEVSVRWVEACGRYLLLASSGPEDPIGHAITLRTATDPWGPWTPRRRLLDWVSTGMAHHDPNTRFIKAVPVGDPVGDRVFPAQARGTGAAYAPYLYDAAASGGDLVLRYTLSTWNPYQVVLMSHRLALADLRS